MSKPLYEALKARGLLEFGSVIMADTVREILGIEYPEFGTKKEFDELTLIELGAIDYVRNLLLNEGKYLAGHQGDYRILLPSENKRQVEAYMAQADRKMNRALKLSSNTPATDDAYSPHADIDVRIAMKRTSARRGIDRPAAQPA